MAASSSLVVFTDIDGTLCEPGTRALAGARTALSRLAASDTPVVLVTDEGADCVIGLQLEIRLRHPFICGGGGFLYIPHGYFAEFHDLGERVGTWDVLSFQRPCTPAEAVRLLVSLYRASSAEPLLIVGLGDAWADRIMLAEVDVPVIVRNPAVNQRRLLHRLPNAYVTLSSGPAGWSEAILGPEAIGRTG